MNERRFGEYIKGKRLDLHQTRDVFANHIGISSSYLNAIERGTKTPSSELITVIARHIKMRSSDLFGILNDEETEKPKSRIPDMPEDPPLTQEEIAALNDPRLGGIFYSKPYLSRLSNRQLRQIALDALTLIKEIDENEQ
ncbi:MAG: helix-turn-helix transcriptional regulator [Taibaiella sp.]|nr:helix-turn-helix transcriptional regulator [Taibaiella sp.]